MIDSSKLLSRASSNRNLISRKVLVDLTIIKRDAVKVDSLLKERLVLIKVRDGILRQQRENEMRRERERQLEEKRDDESANVDPKKKKQPKSLLGNIIKFVLGGFLKVFGRLTLRILPRLPLILKTIVRFTRFFGTIIRGTFNIARVLIKIAPKIIKVAGGFGTKIFFAIEKVIGAIAASTTGFIANIIGNLTAPLTGAFGRRIATDVTGAVKDSSKVKTTGLIDRRAKLEQLTLDDAIELSIRQAKQRQPLEMAESAFGTTDQLQIEKKFVKQKTKVASGNMVEVDQKSFFDRTPRSISKKISADGFTQGSFIRTMSKTGDIVINPKFLTMKNKKIFGDIVQESLAQRDLVDSFGDLSDVELRNMGFDPDEIKSNRFTKAMKDAAEEAVLDEVNAARKTVKASKLVGKKGISRFLVNAGGETLEQTVKQSIKASVGVIPILGDLIGVLLDVYLFGEPRGRAVFKGIGSFALGAILAGVGTFLGGPVGTLIGSIVGGIGGDILGGIAYDLFFGRKPQAGGYSTVTGGGKEYLKGVSKAVNIQYYNEGGLVARKSRNKKNTGIDPRILELYPELDPMKPSDYIKLKRKTLPVDLALRSQAFYERNQVGREVMIPIPVPISNNKNQGGGQNIVIHSKNVQKRNSFSQLYRRG